MRLRRAWTSSEIRYLKRHYAAGTRTPSQIAAFLKRSRPSVRSFAKSHGLCCKTRLFSPAEVAYVQAHRHDPAASVAAALHRPLSSIYNLKQNHGLSKKYADYGPKFEEFLRTQNAAGWSDSDIAKAWGGERHAVSRRRIHLGLPFQGLSDRQRDKVRVKTRAQCQAAGVKSLSDVRVLAFQHYAVKYGWPADLKPREVQMLNFLLKNGPSTRRQIADGIGMPWKGARTSLTGNRPEGTYLMHLINRGLCASLGRVVKGEGSGYSTCLYTVPLSVAMQRSAHNGQKHVA